MMGTAAGRHERSMNKAVSSSRSFRIRSVIGWSIGGDDDDDLGQKSANPRGGGKAGESAAL